ncbi:uncharacterized protein TNCT_261681 [Trichonephila clavata]|uniref:Uncharacterized protein n=1 Tax=Trichonephila clavata TaxID=2740835 RepID=A0A8X6L8Q9_TRICU|nr:uncharacterized protein TNCT_261681 [Trichonephila clavata]
MSDQIPTITQLNGSIPQIVITEPSPMINGREYTITGNKPIPAVKTTPEVGIDVTTSPIQNQSGEFIPDPDCDLCNEDKSPSQEVMIPDEDDIVSEGIDETDDVFRNLPSNRSVLNRCLMSLVFLSESKFMLLILVLLLGIPLSAGFMGAKYMDQCVLSPETPMFLFMLGIAGTIVIICRILLITQKIILPRHSEWQLLSVIMVVGIIAIVVCLTTEMFAFFRKAPSFEPEDISYCHKTFYIFTYWINWISVIVLTVLLILEVLKCSISSRVELVP